MPSVQAMALKRSEANTRRDQALAAIARELGIAVPVLIDQAKPPSFEDAVNQAEVMAFLAEAVQTLFVPADTKAPAKKEKVA